MHPLLLGILNHNLSHCAHMILPVRTSAILICHAAAVIQSTCTCQTDAGLYICVHARGIRKGIVALAMHQHHFVGRKDAGHSREQPAHIYHVVADQHPPHMAASQHISQSCP